MNINTGREFSHRNSQDDGPGHPHPVHGHVDWGVQPPPPWQQQQKQTVLKIQRCPRDHALVWTQFATYRVCDRCRAKKLRNCVSCVECGYDVCMKCCSEGGACQEPDVAQRRLAEISASLKRVEAEIVGIQMSAHELSYAMKASKQ